MLNTLKNTSLVYLDQTRIRSQLIYIITLLTVIVALTSLPFLYTTVSVKGQGLIQSSVEITSLLAPTDGRLVSINFKDNQTVQKGTILLVIDTTLPNQHNGLLIKQYDQLQKQLHDIEKLSKMDYLLSSSFSPSTALYQTNLQEYQAQIKNAINARKQAERIYMRYEVLYNKKVVTLSEYEQYKFNYHQALSDEQLVDKKYKSQWQIEANQYRNELRDLLNQLMLLKEQEKKYRLKAPITGSLQNLVGIQSGTYVSANQKLGEISPDSALIAYCYIKPKDIGLIKMGQEARFQIDAFNYNQWGMLKGKVIDIADDIMIKDQTAYFKVKCQLSKSYLQLKNGHKGFIKKGMTFKVNFTVARRSLYQLLYDKVDDWLNPIG